MLRFTWVRLGLGGVMVGHAGEVRGEVKARGTVYLDLGRD